jgi:hypothetical protein
MTDDGKARVRAAKEATWEENGIVPRVVLGANIKALRLSLFPWRRAMGIGEPINAVRGDTRPLVLSLRRGGSATGLSVTGARALPMQVITYRALYLGE